MDKLHLYHLVIYARLLDPDYAGIAELEDDAYLTNPIALGTYRLLAASEAKAKEMAMAFILDQWSQEDGWIDHTVHAEKISRKTLLETLALISEDAPTDESEPEGECSELLM